MTKISILHEKRSMEDKKSERSVLQQISRYDYSN